MYTFGRGLTGKGKDDMNKLANKYFFLLQVKMGMV